ncbi:MAG: class I SAM-dependent methyltransferase [Gemmatimonadota bacterium]
MSRQLLDARAAYRVWAPHYEVENAVTTLEDTMVRELTPPLAGARLLDAACGTARRLRAAHDASLRVGIDLVPEMLAVAREPLALIAGNLEALPVRAAGFDVVWCRLALSHVQRLDLAYAELARAAAPDATIVISDFHATAAAAGHTRSFRADDGQHIEVQSFAYDADAHLRAAAAAGLHCTARTERGVAPEIEHFYAQAGHIDWYTRDLGLPLVLGLAFQH